MANSLHESAYAVCCEAMALLREEQELNENCVLYGQDPATGTATVTANKVEAACNRSYETARHDILDTYNWSFAKRDTFVKSTLDDHGRFVTPYPGVAEVKILTCLGVDGDRVEWSLRGREKIISREPIDNIVYMEDVEDVTEWPRIVRNALVFRLASLLAVEITGRAADADMYDKKSQQLVQKARTDDARQAGSGTSVYGRNYLYDVATGRRRAKNMRYGYGHRG